uniref:Uncharacterized protein n=1 Tax=Timema monikensis TaxID=170555 RepID=A0A7R9HQV5_9NEOP|nr:unnamed protein product [Timema monikensis]
MSHWAHLPCLLAVTVCLLFFSGAWLQFARVAFLVAPTTINITITIITTSNINARTTPQQHPSQRRHSVSAMCVSTTTITTTGASVPGCSHQRTHSLPLSEPAPGPSLDARRGSTGRVSKRANASLRSRYQTCAYPPMAVRYFI